MYGAAAAKLREARDAALKKEREGASPIEKDGVRVAVARTPEAELHRRNGELWDRLAHDFEQIMGE